MSDACENIFSLTDKYTLMPMVVDSVTEKICDSLVDETTPLSNQLRETLSDVFINIVQKLKKLQPGQLGKLNLVVKKSKLKRNLKKAIF